MNNVILIQDLHFRWHADLPETILIDHLSVSDGESLFIKGPSGSGKSTLLNLISGVVRLQKGVLKVLGEDMAVIKPSAADRLRGERMGFIFQQFNLVPFLSVLENILLPLEVSAGRNRKLAVDNKDPYEEAFRLLSELRLRPKEIIDKPVSHLSVGQQQRVAAARALIAMPDLVIADEPTSALDADTRDSFVRVLFDECKREQSTLIFVSHDGSLAAHFDRHVDLTVLNKAYKPLEDYELS